MLPTHSSPKFIRHHARLIESFQVLQACSACWKNQRQATGFLITRNPRNILNKGVSYPLPLGLLQGLTGEISQDFMQNVVRAGAQRARHRYSPCPVVVDLGAFTEHPQHQQEQH